MKEKDLRNLTENYLKDTFLGQPIIFWFAPCYKHLRWDIFSIFDLITIIGKDIFFIQITDISNLSHRRKKIISFFKEKNIIIPNSFIYAWGENKKLIIEKIV